MILSFLSIILYCIFILMVSFKINQREDNTENNQSRLKISVVIACKNEGNRILEKNINSIVNQDYEKENYELIFVDDNSTDNTFETLIELQKKFNFKLLKNESHGKKMALTTAIKNAKYDFIFVTDADCILKPNHLKNMVNYFEKNNLEMLCGAVVLKSENIFEEFQKQESSALVGISYSTLKMGYPTTCNGANLMFSKQKFIDLNGYESHINIKSGDDDLLMQNWIINGAKVDYLIHESIQVETLSSSKLKEFLNQRIRWISKSSKYIYPYNKIIQTIVFIHLLAFWHLTCLLFVELKLQLIFFLFLKYSVDLIYGYFLKKHFKINFLYILLMPFYQIYVFVILVLSLVKKVSWR